MHDYAALAIAACGHRSAADCSVLVHMAMTFATKGPVPL